MNEEPSALYKSIKALLEQDDSDVVTSQQPIRTDHADSTADICMAFTEPITKEKNYFNKAFVNVETAKHYHDQTTKTAADLGMTGTIIILPPLTQMKATDDIQLKISPSFVLICFKEGPMIPAVEQKSLAKHRDLLCALYNKALSEPVTVQNASKMLTQETMLKQ